VLTTTSGILLLAVLLAFGINEVSGERGEAAGKPDGPTSLTSGRQPCRLVRFLCKRAECDKGP
jgi:hypothetical protein